MMNYLAKAESYLGVKAEVAKVDFGSRFIKGNWAPPLGIENVVVEELDLPLRGMLLHEAVLMIESNITVRSHQETNGEIIVNIGNNSITYFPSPGESRILMPGQARYSLKPDLTEMNITKLEGFNHGFGVEESDTGLIYI